MYNDIFQLRIAVREIYLELIRLTRDNPTKIRNSYSQLQTHVPTVLLKSMLHTFIDDTFEDLKAKNGYIRTLSWRAILARYIRC